MLVCFRPRLRRREKIGSPAALRFLWVQVSTMAGAVLSVWRWVFGYAVNMWRGGCLSKMLVAKSRSRKCLAPGQPTSANALSHDHNESDVT
jgi:hypothetical protein